MASTPSEPLLPLPAPEIRLPGTFWKPNPAFIAELAEYLSGKKVLEIFGGNGLLAGFLAARRVDITCTSILSRMDAHEFGLYHPVIPVRSIDAVRTLGDTHEVLLMCWPTVTQEVLAAAGSWGCERDIVFIGEITIQSLGLLGAGGCATDEFFDVTEVVHTFATYRTRNMLERAVVLRLKA